MTQPAPEPQPRSSRSSAVALIVAIGLLALLGYQVYNGVVFQKIGFGPLSIELGTPRPSESGTPTPGTTAPVHVIVPPSPPATTPVSVPATIPPLEVRVDQFDAPLNPDVLTLLDILDKQAIKAPFALRDEIKQSGTVTRLDIAPASVAYHNVKIQVPEGMLYSVSINDQQATTKKGPQVEISILQPGDKAQIFAWSSNLRVKLLTARILVTSDDQQATLKLGERPSLNALQGKPFD